MRYNLRSFEEKKNVINEKKTLRNVNTLFNPAVVVAGGIFKETTTKTLRMVRMCTHSLSVSYTVVCSFF